ncbi:hypothetical protein DL98DRAFT_145681 [Cadophora sp. DSE1049]|nr:hypothetical protein DL98DRAFT_145681 [Cadophora sp. DSE1049]
MREGQQSKGFGFDRESQRGRELVGCNQGTSGGWTTTTRRKKKPACNKLRWSFDFVSFQAFVSLLCLLPLAPNGGFLPCEGAMRRHASRALFVWVPSYGNHQGSF